MRFKLFILLLMFLLTVALPQVMYAAGYGEGNYGEGAYNEGESQDGGSSTSTNTNTNSASQSDPGPPVCHTQPPGGTAIWLYGALPQLGGTSVMLNFTDAADPYDYYALEYGLEPGKYIYASNYIGGKGIRSYEVKNLTPYTTYYFRVRPGNGCATGGWSNEISAKTSSLIAVNTLVFNRSVFGTAPEDGKKTAGSCQPYQVQPGDSLWSIAVDRLGSGTFYQRIIENNQQTYPSLQNSQDLKVGWELEVCSGSEAGQGTPEQTEKELSSEGYSLTVKILNKDQQLVEGAEVTIHSTPRTAKTDAAGIARFDNVEAGEHRVLIAYEGYSGEQRIHLSGEVKQIDLQITVEQKPLIFNTVLLGVIAVMAVIIAVLAFVLIRKRGLQSRLAPGESWRRK